MKISKATLIGLVICLLMIKLSWGMTYLEKVNGELNGNPQIYFSSPNYVFNNDAYDSFLIYALTLDEIKYKANPIPLYQVIIWSVMGGYILNDVTN